MDIESPQPESINLHKKSRILEIKFNDGQIFDFEVAEANQGSLTVQIGSGLVDDAAGNPTSAISNLFAVTFDTVQATPVITSTESPGPSNADPIPISVDFGEVMAAGEFIGTEVVTSSGAVTGFTTGDDQTFTFNVDTPDDNALLTVDIA